MIIMELLAKYFDLHECFVSMFCIKNALTKENGKKKKRALSLLLFPVSILCCTPSLSSLSWRKKIVLHSYFQ